MESINDIRNNIFKMRDKVKGDSRYIEIDKQYQKYVMGHAQIGKAVDPSNVENNLKNPDFLLYLMKDMPEEYKNLPEEYKTDKKYILKAVKSSPSILAHVPEEFKNDKEMIKAVIEDSDIGPTVLKYVNESLKNDKELVLLAVKKNGEVLQYASENLRNDKEVISKALFNNKNSFKYASDELKDDKKFVYEMIQQFNPKILAEVEGSILPNYADVSFLFSYNQVGNILQHVSDRLKDNKGLILHSMQNETEFSLEYVSDRLKDNKDIVLSAIREKSSNFKYASENLRNDKEIVSKAVVLRHGKIDKELMEYASPEIQNLVQEKGIKGLEEQPFSKISSIIKGIRNLATGNSSQPSNKNSM